MSSHNNKQIKKKVLRSYWLPAPSNFLVISGSQTPYIYLYLFE